MSVLPPELLIEPLSRPAENRTKGGKLVKQECSTCGRNYVFHSKLCRICKQYVEHHDEAGAAACIDGRCRMAAARARAGIELDEVDKFVLGNYGMGSPMIPPPIPEVRSPMLGATPDEPPSS